VPVLAVQPVLMQEGAGKGHVTAQAHACVEAGNAVSSAAAEYIPLTGGPACRLPDTVSAEKRASDRGDMTMTLLGAGSCSCFCHTQSSGTVAVD